MDAASRIGLRRTEGSQTDSTGISQAQCAAPIVAD